MKTKTPLTDAIYPQEPAVICTGTALEDLVKLSRRLERENAALRDALATAEVGLKHALMMEPGDPFKRIKAITAALDAVRAARKEEQP